MKKNQRDGGRAMKPALIFVIFLASLTVFGNSLKGIILCGIFRAGCTVHPITYLLVFISAGALFWSSIKSWQFIYEHWP